MHDPHAMLTARKEAPMRDATPGENHRWTTARPLSVRRWTTGRPLLEGRRPERTQPAPLYTRFTPAVHARFTPDLHLIYT
jgi:hypothetical protein